MTDKQKKEQVKALEEEIDKLMDLNLLHAIDRILFLADCDCTKLLEAQRMINDFCYHMIVKYNLFEKES